MSEKEPVPKCPYLLQVTTSSEVTALKAVGKELGFTVSGCTDAYLGRYYRLHQEEKTIAVAVQTGGMGAIGEYGSTVVAWRFHAATEATTILQIGMAFGVAPEVQKVGDVLIAKSILAYDQRDIIVEGEREKVCYPRVKPIMANPSLVRRCEAFLDVWKASRPDCTVRFGAILSGGAIISCTSFRNRLREELQERSIERIIGGEMEGVGLVGVGKGADVLWGVIKGISDFADESRRQKEIFKESRRIACQNAVHFTLGMVLHSMAGEDLMSP